MKRPLLIVNPTSGGGKMGERMPALRQVIERHLGEVDITPSEYPRHAVEISRKAALEGRQTIVAVGGDGTISETVNGVMQAGRGGAAGVRIGIIGQGTGGDFRRTLGLEHRLDRYCEVIAAGDTRAVDVGRFTYADHDGRAQSAYFVNILSFGISGLVDRYVAETSKALGGTVAYFAASLRGLVKSSVGRVRAKLSLRGEAREVMLATRTTAICNGRYFGSGMKVGPMAEVDDGVFDVVDLGGGPIVPFALASSRIYTGSHIGRGGVQHFRADHIEMVLENDEIEDHFLLDVDGEPLGRLPIVVDVEPAAVQFLAPPRSS